MLVEWSILLWNVERWFDNCRRCYWCCESLSGIGYLPAYRLLYRDGGFAVAILLQLLLSGHIHTVSTGAVNVIFGGRPITNGLLTVAIVGSGAFQVVCCGLPTDPEIIRFLSMYCPCEPVRAKKAFAAGFC